MRHFLPALVLVFGFFGYRLYSLQILQEDRFGELARRNFVRSIPVPAYRGRIYDREGRLLVDNVARFDLTLNSRHLSRREVDQTFQALGEILSASPEELRRRWRESPRDRQGSRLVREDVEDAVVVRVSERAAGLPGVGLVERPRRWTVFGEVGAHVLGYTGEITGQELRRPEFAGYDMGDEVGRAGVEQTFEQHLHGFPGERKVRVFADGLVEDEIPGEGTREQPGKDVVLTIDWDLQTAAQEILGASPGAIVVMDPGNGDILAMVSSPSYDPNMFSVRSPERGLILNRQVRGVGQLVNTALEAYPPGSVFKVPLALAALDSGRLAPDSTYECAGLFYLPNWESPWRCWIYGVGSGRHGAIDVVHALQYSCDSFFYNLGRHLGDKFMDQASREFGFGEPTGIALPYEKVGFRPSPESKRRAMSRFGGRGNPAWVPGDTINASIGQGVVLTTPLQVTCMMAIVANGGTRWQPRVVKEVRTAGGEAVEGYQPVVRSARRFRVEALATVVDGLDRVVNAPGGTAYARRAAGLEVCGKTATAQNEDPEHDHAWFTCFAPRENPEVVVTVLALWGGHGGAVAAPKAMEVLGAYFAKRKQESASRGGPVAAGISTDPVVSLRR